MKSAKRQKIIADKRARKSQSKASGNSTYARKVASKNQMYPVNKSLSYRHDKN